MALLERIAEMKQNGLQDFQIMNSLKEEGVSPREINEALSQLKIKDEINNNSNTPIAGSTDDMQPSIMPQSQDQQTATFPQQQTTQNSSPAQSKSPQQSPAQYSLPQPYTQNPQYSQTQQYSQEQQYPQTQQYSQEQQYSQYPQDQYSQEAYSQEAYYPQGLDLETIREITRQEIETSLKKIKEDVESLGKLKTDLKFEMQNLDNRIAKIESIIQELQSAIIRKLGEYGESVSNISKELRATQDSFSKILNPVLDKKRGISEESNETEEEQSEEKPSPKKSRQESKDSASFEDYLR